MEKIGRVAAVYGPVVDILFLEGVKPSELFEIFYAKDYVGEDVILEVVERKTENMCRCIALSFTYGLQRNSVVYSKRQILSIPPARYLFGRVLNVLGQPIDGKGPILEEATVPTHKAVKLPQVKVKDMYAQQYEILETGIKVIDLLFPFVKGAKTGILGGAACGKSIIILEIIYSVLRREKGKCVFGGIGERIREGNELYLEFLKRGLLDQSILVFGQMDESPGVRYESAHTALTVAESLRDDGENVLLFVDNIFRFAQAGSELSALLERIPSETGYQPTLTSEELETFGAV